jgi:hypothetical protein
MSPTAQGRNATAGSRETPDVAARVTAFDGGVSGATSGLTAAAAEAGRAAAPSNVQSPTGCCDGLVRPNRNFNDMAFIEEEEEEVAEDTL